MVAMLAFSVADYWFGQEKSKTINLVFSASSLSSKSKELVSSQSGECVQVDQYFYQWIVVSVI